MPDIPFLDIEVRPAENLIKLGEGFEALGEAFANVSKQQAAKARDTLDTAATTEYLKARQYYDQAVAAFNSNMENDPEHGKYKENWDKTYPSILEGASQFLTLPASQSLFNVYVTEKLPGQLKNVYDTANTALDKDFTTTVMSFAVSPSTTVDDLTALLASQIVRDKLPTTDYKNIETVILPKAKQDKVKEELEDKSPEQAAALLFAGKYDDYLGKASAQELAENYQSIAKNQKALAESISTEQGLKNWDEYDKKWTENGFKDLAEMESYVFLVDESHRQMVRDDVERYRAGLQDGVKYDQDKRSVQIINDMMTWVSNGYNEPAPWDEKKVSELAGQKYTNGEPVLREDNLADIKKMFMEVEKLRDDPQATALYTKLYSAMDAGKNPALAVSLAEIDTQIQDMAKNTALKAKRRELQAQYEAEAFKTKESAEYEAAAIIFDVTKSQKEKRDWLALNRRNFSGDDYAKWLGRIDSTSGVNERTDIYKSINEYFNKEMSKPDISTAALKQLAIERYDALIAFEEYMMTVDDPKKWQIKYREFLDEKTYRNMEDAVEGKLGALFGPTLGVPAWRRQDILEAAREQGILVTYPAEAKEYEAQRKEIEKRDQTLVLRFAAKGAKIKTVTPSTRTNEAFYYTTDNKVYYVRYEVKVDKDGAKSIVRVVYGATVGDKEWTRVGNE